MQKNRVSSFLFPPCCTTRQTVLSPVESLRSQHAKIGHAGTPALRRAKSGFFRQPAKASGRRSPGSQIPILASDSLSESKNPHQNPHPLAAGGFSTRIPRDLRRSLQFFSRQSRARQALPSPLGMLALSRSMTVMQTADGLAER